MNWRRHIIAFLVIFALGAFVVMRMRACTMPAPARPGVRRGPFVVVEIDRWTIKAELADTPRKRLEGLQHRQALVPGSGMLFVFDETCVPEFWMKDVSIPLSVAFISSDGTIVSIRQMAPIDEAWVLPPQPCDYALEVRRGWFEDRGVCAGHKVVLPTELPRTPPEGGGELTGSREPH